MVSWGKPLADGAGRHAPTMVGGHVLGHQGPGADDGPVPDGDAGEDDGLIADPDIAADDNVPPLSQASVTRLPSSPTR